MESKNYLQENNENKFEIFDYNSLGSVRACIDEYKNKWFCLKDVCDILGLKEPHRVSERLDSKGRHSMTVLTNGGPQQMFFINEANLFRLITGSRKPEARKFTDWVCDVVLPSLNSKGYYIMDNKPKDEVIRDLQSKVDILENKMANIDSGIKSLEYVTNTTYMRISAYARYRHLGINLTMATYLGRMASKISMERDVPVFSEPHEEFGTIRIYRADILKFVFDSFYNDADIAYGDCE